MAYKISDGSFADLFVRGIKHYQQHPMLMLPFLIQAVVGILLTWFNSRAQYAGGGLYDVFIGVIIVMAVVNFFVQVWGFRIVAASLDGGFSFVHEFGYVLRRWVSVVGVLLLSSLPIAVLMSIFIQMTDGFVLDIAITLTVTLVHWLLYLSYIGVIDADMRAWPAFKEAVLLLATPRTMVMPFLGILLLFNLLGFSLTSTLAVGVALLNAGQFGIFGSVLWILISIVFVPLLTVWFVIFHRQFRLPPPETEAGEEATDVA